ncbi:MAG: GHKL domain-containing protein [Proteobacteria bacterium]|nr:GHKL domain-containing protein [Pseudomonadota bacterium]
MESAQFATQFAPAERASAETIDRQSSTLADVPLFVTVLNAVPSAVMVTNDERQVIFANNACLDMFDLTDRRLLYGRRFGEAVHCEHACHSEGGCGTTDYCSQCGAIKALLTAQQGAVEVQECRINVDGGAGAFDLRAVASPFEIEGLKVTIFAVSDISDEKRRNILERIFFHDLLNTAGNLRGFTELMRDATREELDEYRQIVYNMSERLLDEINSQKELLAAENNQLSPTFQKLYSLEILRELHQLYQKHDKAEDRIVAIDPSADDTGFVSDKTLILRVLGNMVKNALEASRRKSTITVSCRRKGEEIEFSIHNPGVVPPKAQLQIFQRSFSTKGAGRGLGTYSMKLLSERYLKGQVSFTTSEENGTTFTARYPLK